MAHKFKFQVLSEYKTPFPLNRAESLKIQFPTEQGEPLEKQISSILCADKGICEIELSDFELQALPVGEVSFTAKIFTPDLIYNVAFTKALTVGLEGERKTIL